MPDYFEDSLNAFDEIPQEVMEEISVSVARKKQAAEDDVPPGAWDLPMNSPRERESPAERKRSGRTMPGRDRDGGDVREIKNTVESLGDQMRVIQNLMQSMEMQLSASKKGENCAEDHRIAEIKDILIDLRDNGFLVQLDKRFDIFLPENIGKVFDNLDDKMKKLNERSKSWQLSLDQASAVLGRKAVVFGVASGFASGVLAAIIIGVVCGFFGLPH